MTTKQNKKRNVPKNKGQSNAKKKVGGLSKHKSKIKSVSIDSAKANKANITTKIPRQNSKAESATNKKNTKKPSRSKNSSKKLRFLAKLSNLRIGKNKRVNNRPKKQQKGSFFAKLFRLILLFCFSIALVGIASIVLYGVELNRKYKLSDGALDGVLWELPSRVYARPLELYVGKLVDVKALEKELNLLGYVPDKSLSRPGMYEITDYQIVIHKREFMFSDGEEPEQLIRVTFDEGKIIELLDLDLYNDIAIVRLDPLLIGSIYPKHAEDRILIDLDETPQILIDTILATEDRRFYNHFGIDVVGLARALKMAFKSGRVTQGASTITQQFIKNHYLTNDRKLSRKIKEIIMAVIIDAQYSKKQILEGYLNEIFLGQDGKRAIHGFGLAAEHYFGKSLRSLKLHEIAALVALVKEPSRANPYRHPDFAKRRRALILDVMVKQGLISEQAAEIAKNLSLKLVNRKNKTRSRRYHSFLQLVYKQLHEQYDRDKLSSGLNVFTTLDPIVQEKNEKVVKQSIALLEEQKQYKRKNHLQVAVVMVDSASAEIISLIGDRKPNVIGFNRAVQAKRPPGSLLKPIVYMAALEYPHKYTLATKISDAPFTYRVKGEKWSPKNYSKKNKGSITLIDSLVHSYNIPTARVALDIGIDDVIGRLEDLGARKGLPNYPSISLGTVGMSPLEVAQIYEPLANGGYYMPLRAIRSVTDINGEIVDRYLLESTQVISKGPYYLIAKAMQQTVSRGTAKKLNDILPEELNIAGKTGTTDDYRDSWFAGFTGNLLSVVWVGNDNNKKIELSGSKGAMRVWGNLMSQHDLVPFNPVKPDGVIERDIYMVTGRLASSSCVRNRYTQVLPFLYGSEPQKYSYCYQPNKQEQKENDEAGWFQSFEQSSDQIENFSQ